MTSRDWVLLWAAFVVVLYRPYYGGTFQRLKKTTRNDLQIQKAHIEELLKATGENVVPTFLDPATQPKP